MSNAKGNPGSQPFQGPVRKNLTKRNSWWQKNPPQNNTNVKSRD